MVLNHDGDLHLGNHPSPDPDQLDAFFVSLTGRQQTPSRENYEPANTLGVGFGGDRGVIRRWMRRRRDDDNEPSQFGIGARADYLRRDAHRARVLLAVSHGELAPSMSLA